MNRAVSIVVELRIPAEEFALGKLLAERPDVRVELERIVPTEEGMMPFFWVIGDDLDFVRSARVADSPVEEIEVLETTDDSLLCRTIWEPEVSGFREILAGNGATLLDAEGEGEEWLFRVRFPDREATSAFHEACDERGIPYEVQRIYSLSELPAKQYGLTDEQREALVAAFEAGYFYVPRETSLSELADGLGISPQAVSGRIRRGLERVLASALFPPGDPEETSEGT